jgi:hypothetical protein
VPPGSTARLSVAPYRWRRHQARAKITKRGNPSAVQLQQNAGDPATVRRRIASALRLLAAVRYVALNPVVAGLVRHAEAWPWSSARAHLAGEDDELATVAPLRALTPICCASQRICRP